MKRSRIMSTIAVLVALMVLGAACGGGEGDELPSDIKADFGVDVQNKVISVGVLNDVSGPASVIGKPFALGKRILAAQVNAGDSGLLPEGWTINLVERDHGYNPQSSVQYYSEIKDQVLFLATSFGTPNTLPLQPLLVQDNIIAFPASLSSAMAENEYTPPIGAPYSVEAMRAMEWAVEQAGGSGAVQAGIIYNEDDYGADGLKGWQQGSEFYGVDIVSEQKVTSTQPDFTAVVQALQDDGATYVMLTTLPSATIAILGTAAQLGYDPVWIGNTPSWIDLFSNQDILPLSARENFYWASSLPLWREDLPGMDSFHEAYAQYGAEEHPPDFYILASYLQGLVELEAVTRALENGDITREGFKQALQSISDFDAGGLFIAPVDLTRFPYVTGTEVRILQPGDDVLEWAEVAPYATPKAFEAG